MDSVFSPGYLAWTQVVHCPLAEMRRLPARKHLPLRRQDLEHGGKACGGKGVKSRGQWQLWALGSRQRLFPLSPASISNTLFKLSFREPSGSRNLQLPFAIQQVQI